MHPWERSQNQLTLGHTPVFLARNISLFLGGQRGRAPETAGMRVPSEGICDSDGALGLKRMTNSGARPLLFRSPAGRNAAWLYVLQFADYLLPLVSVPYLVRVLQPTGYGAVAFAQGLVNYLLLLVDYGFDWSATRKIAVRQHDPVAVNTTALHVWAAKALLSAAGAALLLLAVASVPGLADVSWILLGLYGLVLGNVLFPTWLFQGMERMGAIAAINVGMRTAVLMGIFALVRQPGDAVVYAALTGGGGLVAGVVAAAVAWRIFGLKPARISVVGVWNELKEGWVLFLSRASVSLYTAGNSFIVGMLSGPVAAAYYSAAEKIIKASLGFLGPLSQALYPRSSKLAAESVTAPLFWGRALYLFAGIGLMLSFALFVGAEVIVRVFLGQEYAASITPMRVMAPLPFLISISNVLGIHMMLPLGRDREFTSILFGAGLLNLTAAIILVPALQVTGMATAVLLSEAFVTFTMAVYLRRTGLLPVAPALRGTLWPTRSDP